MDSSMSIEVSLVSIIATFIASLIAWHLWRFTISPFFRPNKPKEYPYWFPFLGHAIGSFRDSNALLTAARNHFGNTCDVFALTIAGQLMYIVTKPRDINEVHKNHGMLTFEGFVVDIYQTAGMSADGLSRIFIDKDLADNDYVSTGAYRTRAALGGDLPHQQLLPGGGHAESLADAYQSAIKEQLDGRNILSKAFVDASPSPTQQRVVSLRIWAAEVLGRASMNAFFGRSLLEISPGHLDAFRAFDSNSWMLAFKLPRLFAKVMYGAMDQMKSTLVAYHQQEASKRADASHWTRTQSQLQKEKGVSVQDRAVSSMLNTWVINGNPSKTTFWLLAYILHNPDLTARIRTEIAPALTGPNELDFARLTDGRSPLFNAAYSEVLRLTAAASSARNVASPTTIGGFQLRPGAKILVPYSQLHYADEFFPDPTVFRPERFLENRKLESASYYRPFGGGITYCSGRYLARQQVLGLAAAVLLRYDVEVVSGQMPRPNLTKPSLGTMEPLDGDDVLLAIEEKAWTTKQA